MPSPTSPPLTQGASPGLIALPGTTDAIRLEKLAAFRLQLLSRRDRIRSSLIDESYFSQSHQDSGGDEADIACTFSSGELSKAILQAESEQLASLNDALSRFDENGFGDCADCGDAIPLARLEAIPHAVCCVSCQAKRESGC